MWNSKIITKYDWWIQKRSELVKEFVVLFFRGEWTNCSQCWQFHFLKQFAFQVVQLYNILKNQLYISQQLTFCHTSHSYII
jgi:hypothetical protein